MDPRWLLRTVGILIVAAIFCGYLTLGLLFAVGSWQLVLHPTRGAGGTGQQSEHVQFGPDASGNPQLAGEWLAAAPGSLRAGDVVLYLRSGDGQLDRGDGTQIAALHDLGLSVLAFDYRGFGGSAVRPHPSEAHMLQDAEDAWNYLQSVRKFDPDKIVLFGSGVGVSLAAQLAASHKPAALIAYNADPDVLARVLRDPRGTMFPVRLLFHERFALDALTTLAVPKLLYTIGPTYAERRAVYASAAAPKLTVEVPTHDAEQETVALRRFLDEYVGGR